MIKSDGPPLSTLFPSQHQVFHRRNPTLSSTLVKAALPGHPHLPGKVTPVTIKTMNLRTHKCNNPHCKACLRKTHPVLHGIQNTSLIPHLLHPLRQVLQDVHTPHLPKHQATLHPTVMPPQENCKSLCNAFFHVGAMILIETT